MPEPGPVARQKRADIKQIDDVVPLQPAAGNESVRNEFEIRITWLFRLTARGPVADHLAASVEHVAKSIAKGILVLGIALGLNLIFTKWTAWNISLPYHFPFSLEQKKTAD
jgi:hypothetical protein